MKNHIDFQMFDEQGVLNIPGIDADILQELASELPAPVAEEEPVAEPTEGQEPEDKVVPEGESAPTDDGQGAEPEEATTADADSDTKQVDGEGQGAPVPYTRFKQEYAKRKAAEAELAELKAKMNAPAVPVPSVQPVDVPAEPKQEDKPDFIKALTAEAMRRAKVRLGLTDEAMANMEFEDNLEARTQFQLAVQQESAALMESARKIAQEREAFERGVSETTGLFTNFVNEFQALPDAAERWDFIANQKFLELPAPHQAVIKAAFERLQNKRGTPQVYYLAKSYFDSASAEFTARSKPVAPAPVQVVTPVAAPSNVAAKVKAAQALPKVANVGGTAAKPGMTVEEIAAIMNEPGVAALDKIPPDILKKIMSGQPLG